MTLHCFTVACDEVGVEHERRSDLFNRRGIVFAYPGFGKTQLVGMHDGIRVFFQGLVIIPVDVMQWHHEIAELHNSPLEMCGLQAR